MSTSAVIALTPEALNVLFPEGSQARVDLQRASLDRAARHFAKNALGDGAKHFLKGVVAAVSEENMEAVRDELKKHFGASALGFGRQRFVLAQDIKDRIKEAVEAEVRTTVRDAVDAAILVEGARLKELAASHAKTAVYNLLKTETVAAAQQELENRVAALKADIAKTTI